MIFKSRAPPALVAALAAEGALMAKRKVASNGRRSAAAKRERTAEANQIPARDTRSREAANEDDRVAAAHLKYPLQQETEEALAKKSSKRRSSAPKGKAINQEDIAVGPFQGPTDKIGVTSNIDHGALNHPRSESPHVVGEGRAAVEGPVPMHPRLIDDPAVLLEQLRLETKADNLYLQRQRERDSDEPRQHVIEAINQRLREVQGEPLRD
jgi:hypothetical protein